MGQEQARRHGRRRLQEVHLRRGSSEQPPDSHRPRRDVDRDARRHSRPTLKTINQIFNLDQPKIMIRRLLCLKISLDTTVSKKR